MRISTLLMAGVIASALTSCASTGADDKPRGIAAYADDIRLGEEVPKICFSSSIDGFRAAEKDTVILDRGVRDEYIVEVMGGCQNLRHAQSIQLDSHMSCLSKFDNLIVYDSAFGTQTSPNSRESCAIKKIHKWNEKAVAETEVEDGMKDEDEIANSPIK